MIETTSHTIREGRRAFRANKKRSKMHPKEKEKEKGEREREGGIITHASFISHVLMHAQLGECRGRGRRRRAMRACRVGEGEGRPAEASYERELGGIKTKKVTV